MTTLLALALSSLLAAPPHPPGSAEEVAAFVKYRDPAIVLEDVRVIDGTGAPAREHQSVLLERGRIARVGDTRGFAVPSGARRLELAGKTVLPGLVMLHEHMMYFSGFRVWHSQAVSYPRLYLAAGVTTVRTAGTDFPYNDANLQLGIEEGRIAGPRIILTGPFLNGYAAHFIGDDVVRTEADGRREAAYWAGRGFPWLKVYSSMTLPALRGVITEAHRLGARVTGHLGSVSCADAADAGIDDIEHSFSYCMEEVGIDAERKGFVADPEAPRVKALMRKLIDRKVALTATPSAGERPISAAELDLMHPDTRARYQRWLADPDHFGPDIASEREVRKLERAFAAAGGRLVLGADPQDFGMIAGYADHRVLELMVEAGFSPLEVIRMATLGDARFLGLDRDLGSIAEGKAADLLVVAGDPSSNIADIEKVELVFKGGVAYDPALLRQSAKGLVGWH